MHYSDGYWSFMNVHMCVNCANLHANMYITVWIEEVPEMSSDWSIPFF